MRLTTKILKNLILEAIKQQEQIQKLNELDMSEVGEMCYIGGSTHSLATCKIEGGDFFLKFSDSWDFKNSDDKSLQIGVEYLAYLIYSLYPSNIPQKIHVVSDPQNQRIGIATKKSGNKSGRQVDFKQWVKSISGGAMVDIFLANWDVNNTANFVIDNDGNAWRVDPGGSLTFRARGGRKGDSFSPTAGELKTMLDPKMRGGAGWLLSEVDMKEACEAFIAVPWESIVQKIEQARTEVTKELNNAKLTQVVDPWNKECDHIKTVLKTRWVDVKDHCEHALQEMQKV